MSRSRTVLKGMAIGCAVPVGIGLILVFVMQSVRSWSSRPIAHASDVDAAVIPSYTVIARDSYPLGFTNRSRITAVYTARPITETGVRAILQELYQQAAADLRRRGSEPRVMVWLYPSDAHARSGWAEQVGIADAWDGHAPVYRVLLDNVPKTLSGQAEGTGNREPQTYLGWTDPDLRLLYRHTRAMRGAAQGTVKLAYERAHGPMWTQDKATAIRYGADVTTIEGLYMDAVAQTHGITAEDMARIIDLGDRLSWASSSPEEETKGHLRFTMVTSRRADRGPSPTSAIGVPQSVQITPAAAPPPLVPSEMVIAAMDIPALRTAEANAAAWIEAWPTSASRSAMLVALRRMRDRLTTHDAAVMSAQDRLERIIADRAYHRLGEARSAVADLDARGSGHLVPDAWRGRLASTDPWILVGSATAGSVLLDLGTWGSAWFHRQRTGRWVQALEMRRPGSLADPIVKVTNVSDADLLIADIRRASGLAVHALSASTYEGAAGVLLPLLDPSDLDRIDPTTQRQGETPFTDHDPLVRLQVLDLLGGAPEAVVDPTRGWQRVQASAVEGWHGSGSLVTWEAGAALAVRLEVAWPPVDAPVP